MPVITTLFTKSFNAWKPISKNTGNVFANEYHVNEEPERRSDDVMEQEGTIQGEADKQNSCSMLCKVNRSPPYYNCCLIFYTIFCSSASDRATVITQNIGTYWCLSRLFLHLQSQLLYLDRTQIFILQKSYTINALNCIDLLYFHILICDTSSWEDILSRHYVNGSWFCEWNHRSRIILVQLYQ